MANFLDEVAAKTRQSLDVLKAQTPLSLLKQKARDCGAVRPFQKGLHQTGRVTLIAELKQASPSAGLIRQENDIEGRIKSYQKGGASALSILTEQHYFRGSPEVLDVARRVSTLPLLRKDFMVDPWQLQETRVFGADAALLIVAILGKTVKDFIRYAEDAGIDSLVEVHDERELDQALEAGSKVIGINNRNLHTLQVDMATAERLAPKVPKETTLVIESGIKTPAEMPRLKSWGANAALIGEALMRSPEPEQLVREFVKAGQS